MSQPPPPAPPASGRALTLPEHLALHREQQESAAAANNDSSAASSRQGSPVPTTTGRSTTPTPKRRRASSLASATTDTDQEDEEEAWFAHEVEPGVDVTRADFSDIWSKEHLSITTADWSAKRCRINEDLDSRTFLKWLDTDRPAWSKARWINLNGLSWDVFKALAVKYELHPLAVEDALHVFDKSARSKSDWYANHLFVRLIIWQLCHSELNDVFHPNHESEDSDNEDDFGSGFLRGKHPEDSDSTDEEDETGAGGKKAEADQERRHVAFRKRLRRQHKNAKKTAELYNARQQEHRGSTGSSNDGMRRAQTFRVSRTTGRMSMARARPSANNVNTAKRRKSSSAFANVLGLGNGTNESHGHERKSIFHRAYTSFFSSSPPASSHQGKHHSKSKGRSDSSHANKRDHRSKSHPSHDRRQSKTKFAQAGKHKTDYGSSGGERHDARGPRPSVENLGREEALVGVTSREVTESPFDDGEEHDGEDGHYASESIGVDEFSAAVSDAASGTGMGGGGTQQEKDMHYAARRVVRQLTHQYRVALERQQLSLFVTKDRTIISIFSQDGAMITPSIVARLRSKDTLLRSSEDTSMLLQALLDVCVDKIIDITEEFRRKLDLLEGTALVSPQVATVKHLHVLSQQLMQMRRSIQPIQNVITGLRAFDEDRASIAMAAHGRGTSGSSRPAGMHGGAGGGGTVRPVGSAASLAGGSKLVTNGSGKTHLEPGSPTPSGKQAGFVSPMAMVYLGDVSDHVESALSSFDLFSGMAQQLEDYIFNLLSFSSNNTMQQLTYVSLLFLPLSFLSGYFGMNFESFDAIQGSVIYFWEIAVPVTLGIVFILAFPDVLQLLRKWHRMLLHKQALRQRNKRRQKRRMKQN